MAGPNNLEHAVYTGISNFEAIASKKPLPHSQKVEEDQFMRSDLFRSCFDQRQMTNVQV